MCLLTGGPSLSKLDTSLTELTGHVPLAAPSTAVASTSSIVTICTAEEECGSTGIHIGSGHGNVVTVT